MSPVKCKTCFYLIKVLENLVWVLKFSLVGQICMLSDRPSFEDWIHLNFVIICGPYIAYS